MKKIRLHWHVPTDPALGEFALAYTVEAWVRPGGSWHVNGHYDDQCACLGFEDTVEKGKLAAERRVRAILGCIRWREACRDAKLTLDAKE